MRGGREVPKGDRADKAKVLNGKDNGASFGEKP